jgi:hypothetical protein
VVVAETECTDLQAEAAEAEELVEEDLAVAEQVVPQ